MGDTLVRSIVKSVTWRILGIVILFVLAYVFTGNWQETTLITVTFHGIRLVLYVFHERAWERVEWERVSEHLPKLGVKDKRKPIFFNKKLRGFVDLMRLFTLLGAFLAGFFMVMLFSGFFGVPLNFWLAVAVGLCMALLQAGGQSLNQALPEEIAIDVKNGKTYRPTVKGVVSVSEAKGFATILFCLGVALSFMLNSLFGVFSLIIMFFAVFYTAPPLRVKKYFFFSNVWQGFARGFLPVVSVWMLSPQPFHIVPLALGCVIAVWCAGAQATKDLGDVEGDRLYGVKTFFVALGKEKAVKLITVLMTLSFSLLIIFVIDGLLPLNYLWLLALTVPSAWIIKTLRKPVTLQLLENQISWAFFYITLGLFYIMSAVLI